MTLTTGDFKTKAVEEVGKVVLCEKPSVARDIARFLKANQKRVGYFEGNGWVVTWAFGHLLELKDPHEYRPEWKAWKVETLPMVPDAFALKPRGDKGARDQLAVIKKLLKSATEIVCATDAGREGELIFRYIQNFAGVTKKPFQRLWISSLTNEALAQGFKQLRPGADFNALFQAARCRSEADWIVGLNATRYFTVLYGGAQGQLWSVGRVQTPVLAMVVERDAEIQKFNAKDYWELHTVFKEALFKYEAGRIDDLTVAQKVLEKIANHPLQVLDRQDKEELVKQPFLYDLTELQKDMNRRFGLSADQTLKAAQSLYEKKYLTYPRTDSKFLTQDMAKDLPGLFEKLRPLKPAEIALIDLKNLDTGSRVVNDLKVTDHHAIIPTGVLPQGLASEESTVYQAVLTRLLAVFYPPGKRRVVNVKARILDEDFKATGSVPVEIGWEILYPRPVKKSASAREPLAEDGGSLTQLQALLGLSVNDAGVHQPLIKTLQTKAALPFTEATLLQMMETAGRRVSDEELKQALKEKGLGTPATRASIIETLLSRGYILRNKKNILSTVLGQRLIALITDQRLKSAELTGEWESRLKQIENESYDPARFMNDVQQYTREIIGLREGEKGLGPCPLCRAEVIEGKRGYGCSQWAKGCTFVIWKDFEGARLDSGLIVQLLRLKQSLSPIRISRAGTHQWVRLSLLEDGSLRDEACEGLAEIKASSESQGEEVGVCPRCGGKVFDSPKAYGCEHWRAGCKFAIWKTIAQKKITLKVAREILAHGKSTEVIEGFKSKKGAKFSARLVLRDQEVKFEFAER